MSRRGAGGSSIEDASLTIRSMYRAIENRDTARLEEVLAPSILALTPESDGVLTSASEAEGLLTEQLDILGEGPLRIRSTDLRIGKTPRGFEAWASDQILVESGILTPMLFRMTAALSWDGSSWRVTAGHCSIPRSNEETRLLVAAKRLPPGVALPDAVDADARPLVELLDECLAEPARFPQVCSTRADTAAFGSASEEVFYGPAVKAAWEEFVGSGPRMRRRGGVAACVSPDHELAWVATHIDISFDVTRPYRFLIVFARTDVGWEMVSVHDSVSSDVLQNP